MMPNQRGEASLRLPVHIDTMDATAPRLLHPAPDVNSGFKEQQSVHFGKPPGSGWTFRVDDEPLVKSIGVHRLRLKPPMRGEKEGRHRGIPHRALSAIATREDR